MPSPIENSRLRQKPRAGLLQRVCAWQKITTQQTLTLRNYSVRSVALIKDI